MEGAGGIGGLLARTASDISNIQSPSHAYYHADGNGNITALINDKQLIVARYLYDPYGNELAATGPLASANLYRFSSKEWHPPSGLVYYGYRFYEPTLQRWLNRDPIQERGGINLYAFVTNSPNSNLDYFGESGAPPYWWMAGLPESVLGLLLAWNMYETVNQIVDSIRPGEVVTYCPRMYFIFNLVTGCKHCLLITYYWDGELTIEHITVPFHGYGA